MSIASYLDGYPYKPPHQDIHYNSQPPNMPSQQFTLGSFIEYIPSTFDTIYIIYRYVYDWKRKWITRKIKWKKKVVGISKKRIVTNEI